MGRRIGGIAVVAAAVVASVSHAAVAAPAPGTITTVVGNGSQEPVANLKIGAPRGVAADRAGNRYFSETDGTERIVKVDAGGVLTELCSACGGWGLAVDDAGNVFSTSGNYVRKIDPSGAVTNVAGNGNAGYSGDGGPATSARLDHPRGVTVDTAGNLYIADGGDRIRRVNPSGTIGTVATFGQLRNVAVDRSGELYIAAGNQVHKRTAAGAVTVVAGTGAAGFAGDDGPATSALLDTVTALAVDDAGGLYLADQGNHRVRRVFNGVIRTWAGNGDVGYGGDYGDAWSATLGATISGIAVAPSGQSLSIGDSDNHRLRQVVRLESGGSVHLTMYPLAGTGVPGNDVSTLTTTALATAGVAVDATGNVYIADYPNRLVRKLSSTGTITVVAGNGDRGFSGDGGPATQAAIGTPYGIALDGTGALYIATGDYRVRKVAANGVISTVAGTGTPGFSGDGGPATAAMITDPTGIAVDVSGNVLIVDKDNHRVRKVNSGGTISTVAGSGTQGYCGDGGQATSACLNWPRGVAADAGGGFYVTDSDNRRVRAIAPNGVISTLVGDGVAGDSGDGGPAVAARLTHPSGITTDRSGNVYVTDALPVNKVRQVTTDGRIRRIAGATTPPGEWGGFGGDGDPATAAKLYDPIGVAIDPNGNVLIADNYNNRIRKVFAPVQSSSYIQPSIAR